MLAGTVTEAGTVTAALSLESATKNPPADAAPVSDTEQPVEPKGANDAGEQVKDDKLTGAADGAVSIILTVRFTAPAVAVMVTGVSVLICPAEAVKPALVSP